MSRNLHRMFMLCAWKKHRTMEASVCSRRASLAPSFCHLKVIRIWFSFVLWWRAKWDDRGEREIAARALFHRPFRNILKQSLVVGYVHFFVKLHKIIVNFSNSNTTIVDCVSRNILIYFENSIVGEIGTGADTKWDCSLEWQKGVFWVVNANTHSVHTITLLHC